MSVEQWYRTRNPELKKRIFHGNSLRLLAAIMQAREDGAMPPGYEEMRKIVGTESNNGVDCHIKRLTNAGLVKHEFNKARTIVPCVRFIPADKLGGA